jgi:hypothetical protein
LLTLALPLGIVAHTEIWVVCIERFGLVDFERDGSHLCCLFQQDPTTAGSNIV